MTRLTKTGGFTLIELMLASAIIGALAAIAIPKFANMIIKAKEASIKGSLGAVRSALSIYYSDNESRYLQSTGNHSLSETLVPKYMSSIPLIQIPTVASHVSGNKIYGSPADMLADLGWGYAAYMPIPFDFSIFDVNINCIHPDSRGVVWITY